MKQILRLIPTLIIILTTYFISLMFATNSFAVNIKEEVEILVKFKFIGYKNTQIDFSTSDTYIKISDIMTEKEIFRRDNAGRELEIRIPVYKNLSIAYGVCSKSGCSDKVLLTKDIRVKRNQQEITLKVPPKHAFKHNVSITSFTGKSIYEDYFCVYYKNRTTEEEKNYCGSSSIKNTIPAGLYDIKIEGDSFETTKRTIAIFKDTDTKIKVKTKKKPEGEGTLNFLFTKPVPEGSKIIVEVIN